jgi:hypothetical protein
MAIASAAGKALREGKRRGRTSGRSGISIGSILDYILNEN